MGRMGKGSASVHACDGRDDRQSQPVILCGAAARTVDAVEAVEKPGQMFCANGEAVVHDADRCFTGLRCTDLGLP